MRYLGIYPLSQYNKQIRDANCTTIVPVRCPFKNIIYFVKGGRSDGSLQDLDDGNQVLMDENSRLIKQNSSLVKQSKSLNSVSATLTASGITLCEQHVSCNVKQIIFLSEGKKGSPKAQVQQLLSDNELLQEAVQRLTVELDKYQEKYGNLHTKKISGRRRMDPESFEPKPKWLVRDSNHTSITFVIED